MKLQKGNILPNISESLFKQSNIKGFSINLTTSLLNNNKYFYANVSFEKDDVSGVKKFRVDDPNGFLTIVKQVDDFIQSLSK